MISTKVSNWRIAVVGLWLSLPGLAFGEPLLLMVPQGEGPEEYVAGPTVAVTDHLENIKFDVMLMLSEPVALRAIAMTVDDATGGEWGYLQLLNVTVDVSRPDFPPTFFGPDILTPPPTFFSNVSFEMPVLEAGKFYYVGEVTYEPLYGPNFGPCGTFLIEFVDPGTHEGAGTSLYDADSKRIPLITNQTLVLIDRPGGYGDVNFNRTVDIQDIFSVLDGFQGTFEDCTFEELDIADCESDGIIDIGDFFAVLDAFRGIQPCVPWCGPPGAE